MEAFVSDEVFPPQPSWEHIKSVQYINLWLPILLDWGGRNSAPTVGQMCAGSRLREGTWGWRRGVRGEAAGKQRLRQLAPPNVPRGQFLSWPWRKTHGAKSCEGGEWPASHLAGLTCYFRNWWKTPFWTRFENHRSWWWKKRHLLSPWAVYREQNQVSCLPKEKEDKYFQGWCWLHGGGKIQALTLFKISWRLFWERLFHY